jgi:hypothetical protein
MPVTFVLYLAFNVTDTKEIVFSENGGCTLSAMGAVAIRVKGHF